MNNETSDIPNHRAIEIIVRIRNLYGNEIRFYSDLQNDPNPERQERPSSYNPNDPDFESNALIPVGTGDKIKALEQLIIDGNLTNDEKNKAREVIQQLKNE